ncbi:hypothetical protein BgAZ_106430 [Babesia gibsoni]|uniref:Uncharacterized protein n=1 Tax=Babesia gibsoni TaxID=33632 RepID=A0AAD8PG58_BABGI|nr:hypothetical protein BgAZ_106430 [Babesia gibsoni]
MESGGDVFKRLSGHVKAALGEVGNQIKHHAKQATKDIGIDIDSIQPPFCTGLNQVKCSMFALPGISAMKRTTVSISGTYSFEFSLKLHPQEIGVVVVTVGIVEESDCVFTWKRKHGSIEDTIDHVQGPRYVLTADDIGTSLVVTCTPSGDFGTAVGEIGPFDVDVCSRRAIQDALVSGTARRDIFVERDEATVDAVRDILKNNRSVAQADGGDTKYVMYIMPDEVQIQPDDDYKGEEIIKCRYSSSFPRFRLCREDNVRFFMKVDEKHEITLRAFSKQQRDLVVLLVRAFHSRLLILNSLEANSIEVLSDGRLQDPTNGGRHLNVVLALQKANDDLSVSLEETSRLRKELRRCKQEKSFLESEIQNTINVFQQQLSENDNKETNRGKQKDKNNEHLYTELINRNAQLAEQLAEMARERDAKEMENDVLKGERNRLEKHSQSIVKDLEKVRFDNECLQKQVEELKAKIRKLASC